MTEPGGTQGRERMSDNGKYLGIDVGGTYIKLGIVTSQGGILCRHRVAVDGIGAEPVMKTIVNAVKEFPQISQTEIAELEGIGICAPGSVDTVKGEIAINGGNVPGWSGARPVEILRKEFGLPVAIANDGNAAVLGEAWTGAAKGCSDVMIVTLGTGVGGGIVSGGRLIEGMRGFGGEIGHFPLHAPDGELCECGRRGCYERYASTSALVRRTKKLDPLLDSGFMIFEALKDGNRALQEILDSWLDEIALGIAGFVHTFNPQIVLIGGGVSAQKERVIEPLEKRLKKLVMPDFAEGLELKGAALGNDAGTIGAVKNLIDRQNAASHSM